MSICGWEVASGSGGRSLASGSWHHRVVTASLASGRMHRVVVAASLTSGRVHQEGCIGKVASRSSGSKFGIGMVALGSVHREEDGLGAWLVFCGFYF